MKVDVINKEETYRTRHISLTLQVEDSVKTHTMKVIVVEDYDVRHNKYTYEFENFSWISDIKGVNTTELEKELENYLADNIEDLLS